MFEGGEGLEGPQPCTHRDTQCSPEQGDVSQVKQLFYYHKKKTKKKTFLKAAL